MTETQVEKYGIENLWKLLALGLEAGNVAGHWAGGEGPAALARLIDEAAVIPSVDFKLLDDEWKDRSEAELVELNNRAATKLQIPQENIEKIVEIAFSMAKDILSLINKGFDMAKVIEAMKAEKAEANA